MNSVYMFYRVSKVIYICRHILKFLFNSWNGYTVPKVINICRNFTVFFLMKWIYLLDLKHKNSL